MTIKSLVVILRRNSRGMIEARVSQMTPEGLKEGSNILKGKKPRDFVEARTHVQAYFEGMVGELIFHEESPDWERN